ncbi:MAG: Gfo/Idh/MocA family oxidoreductase [Nitrospira sp.]|nr:Gfo/Idh/MocA family oxidoreductase [Nitrospira sp.]
MKKIRIGVIGTGAFAETCHVPGLQAHPQAEVVALCGRDHARTSTMARRLNVPDVMTDYQKLCGRNDIDAVTIATPNVLHAVQAQAALAAGKHVFCEKPLGMNVTEVADMLRAAEISRKVHQVAFTYRYLYGVQELKRRLLQGDIGVPHYLRLHYDCWDGLHPDSKVGYREKMNLSGGGMLFDVGSHLFDLARFILGPIRAVTGFTTLLPREREDGVTGHPSAVETDDIAGGWFLSESAVRGEWFASRATPCTGAKASLEVIGRDGALRASLSRGGVDTLAVSSPTRPAWENVPLPEAASDGKAHCLPIMMRSFVDACMRGHLDGQVDASFSDGFAVQQALAAVLEASRRPVWIQL